jgi:CRP/FNR family cyclic AMP-dependent transcriptional regulator
MRKALDVMGIPDDADVEWMAANGRRLGVEKNKILIREGQPVDALFVVLDGTVEVTAGKRTINRLLSGEILGEISFVDSQPPSATVTAAEFSQVLAIPCGLLHARISTDPWFASRFFRALADFPADRLRQANDLISNGGAIR